MTNTKIRSHRERERYTKKQNRIERNANHKQAKETPAENAITAGVFRPKVVKATKGALAKFGIGKD